MINRNNYEEFLLMYVDGELSPSDRKAVESFLRENPDLNEELELLQQAILTPDENVRFAGKDTLYRKQEGISLSNYQEYFLLYIDNELSSSEKAAVETFVLQQPQLQDEFTLLKQTILPKEQVVFTNKASLYRKEEKRKPVVISLRWASLAAAVMIGIVSMVMFNNNGPEQTDAVANGGNNGSSITKPGTVPVTQEVIPGTEQPVENTIDVAGVKHSGSNKMVAQPLKQQVENEAAPRENIANNNYTPQDEHVVATMIENSSNPTVTNTGDPVITSTVNTAEPGEEKNVATTTANDNNNYQPAVYTALEDEEDKTLYVGAMQVNPDKVRGFFRKATRFLSSKVKGNDEDDKGKVRVANMEVNKIK